MTTPASASGLPLEVIETVSIRSTAAPFHPAQKKSKPPCHFHKQGRCLKGTQCPFAHDPVSSPPSTSHVPCYEEPIDVQLGGLNLGGAEYGSSQSYSAHSPPPPLGLHYNDALGGTGGSAVGRPGHNPHIGLTVAPERRKELCIFAVTGKCRYGSLCRSVHGIQCPRCLKFCLHPDDLEQNEGHIMECLEQPASHSIEAEEHQRIECGICFETVLSKPDPRFGLLNCEHAFCIACIRTWRTKYTMDAENLRSCPLCRTLTYFVVPSSVWVEDVDEKAEIIEAYKKKLGEIPCKHYTHGVNTCPFGTSCFYSHVNPDGTVDKRVLRTIVDGNEKANVYRETKLSDFIVFKTNSRKK